MKSKVLDKSNATKEEKLQRQEELERQAMAQQPTNVKIQLVNVTSNDSTPTKKQPEPISSVPALKQYKGVTTQSHIDKVSEPGGKVIPPTTAPAKPVGSPEANPEPEVVKDTSEAQPKNET